MNLCGIIAEINPLTNGHEYLIKEAKRLSKLPVCVIMSGDVVQRGQLPCLDKYSRAKLCIMAGADIVVELPPMYVLSSAQNFAEGAVRCLAELNVTSLAFGVETDNPALLERFAKDKIHESPLFKEALKSHIRSGESYSVAMYKAHKEIAGESKAIDEIFSGSNNILAIEYLSAIYKNKLNITPIFVKRMDNGYNSMKPKQVETPYGKKTFAGATKVRELIEKNKSCEKLVPPYCYEMLKKTKYVDGQERLSPLLIGAIRENENLNNFYDYDPSLSSVIHKNCQKLSSVSEVVCAAKSKCHRESRIRRVLFIPYLGITKEKFKKLDTFPCPLNTLAISKAIKDDLGELQKFLIVSSKERTSLSSEKAEGLRMCEKVSGIYALSKKEPQRKDKTIFV